MASDVRNLNVTKKTRLGHFVLLYMTAFKSLFFFQSKQGYSSLPENSRKNITYDDISYCLQFNSKRTLQF